MKPLTLEWIEKADGDFATAGREIRARKHINYDAVCFHSQQCAEKYLKAILQENGIQFGRTHNLIALLELILPLQPEWKLQKPNLENLTAFAVYVRYPGESTDKQTAKTALASCTQIRRFARKMLGFVD